jgi:hypothetical protein
VAPVRHGNKDAPHGHDDFTAIAVDRSPATAMAALNTPPATISALIRIIFYPFGYSFIRQVTVDLTLPWGVE